MDGIKPSLSLLGCQMQTAPCAGDSPGNKAAVAGWGLCVLWQGIHPCWAFVSSAVAMVRSLSTQFVSSGRKMLHCG